MRNPDGTNSAYASTDLDRMDRLVIWPTESLHKPWDLAE